MSSSVLGASITTVVKQSRLPVLDVPHDIDDTSFLSASGLDSVAALPSGLSRSQSCYARPVTPNIRTQDEADRMTQWIKSVERVVEETRTNFQNTAHSGPATPILPLLPPRRASINLSKSQSRHNTHRRRATVSGEAAFIQTVESDYPDIAKSAEPVLTAADEHPSQQSSIIFLHRHISSVADLELGKLTVSDGN